MNGKDLYEHYLQGWYTAPGSDKREYARTLMTARLVVGDRLFPLLEEAERTGKRIKLIHPIPWNVGPSEPHDVILSSIESANDYTTAADQTGQKNGSGEPPTRPNEPKEPPHRL